MPSDISPDEHLAILERMWLIRAFEEKASELYARGKIGGLLHLGIGQEGVAVGVCGALDNGDYVFGSHRAHAHALARGADPSRLLAEIAGRGDGYNAGKGGSMHISAPDTGFMTATGVVGGNIPLALGAALAAKIDGSDRVAVAFFGDGTGQTGSFHESLNIASLWQLPVVFVCENNGYAEFTPLSTHTNVERLSRHAETYGIPTVVVDGNDVLAVRAAIIEALERARSGGGPAFIEALTYRLRGHYEGDPAKYRELAELDDWKAKDPVARYVVALEAAGVISVEEGESAAAQQRAGEVVEEAAAFADASDWPDPSAVTAHVYAE